MKNETRRGLLTKLGMGAAAITVMSAAGTAAAQAPKFPGKLPQPLRAGVKVNLLKPVNPQSLQVRVAITSAGMVIDAQPIDKALVGVANDNRVLQLGVVLDPKGGVEIQGLNSIIGRAQQAAAGRCWMNLEKGEIVSNPDPTFEGLKPTQMAQF